MKKRLRYFFQFLLFFLMAMNVHGQTVVPRDIVKKKVSIGDPAPPLTLHSWLKGKPVTTFKKGQVYLVEFNNTSCIPCAQTITRLQKISNKFSDRVEIMSIYNHEYFNPFEKHYNNVKKRVENLGDQINFSVAIDVPGRTTEAAWSGEKTKYFIVDSAGRIAFKGISHDAQEMNDALIAVLEGKTLQPLISKQRSFMEDSKLMGWKVGYFFLAEREASKSNGVLPAGYQDSLQAALKYMDDLIKKYPNTYNPYGPKLELLMYKGDANAINAYLASLLKRDDSQEYFNWHWILGGIGKIRHMPGLSEKLDWNLVTTIVDRKLEDFPLLTSVSYYQEIKSDALYYLLSQSISFRMDSLRHKKKTMDSVEFSKRYTALLSERTEAQKQFIKTNPSYSKSLELLEGLVRNYLTREWKNDSGDAGLKEYIELFKQLSPELQQQGQYMYAQLESSMQRNIIPFSGEMPDGKIFDVASLKGKVFLIDFWGSWCGPCRRGHPHLKELYSKYKEKGFEIIGIGHEKQVGYCETPPTRTDYWRQFKEAIIKDDISWPQILNDPDQNDLTKVYMIGAFPTKILVDRNGKVLLRVTSDSEGRIDEKLKELFGF